MKHEDSSSLELLLDTMCNTFGGVMFIAITVAVVLFSKSAVENSRSAEERQGEKREELLAQIAVLQAKLDEQNARQHEMASAVQIMEKDPRLKLLKRLAVMTELVKNTREAQALLLKKNELLNSEITRLEELNRKKTEKLKAGEDAVNAQMENIEKLAEENKALTQTLDNVASRSMTFTMLEKHDERASYFILLKKGRLWRIGPGTEVDEDGILKPLEDVDYIYQNHQVQCTPKPNAGVPALDGSRLSKQCLALIQAIPRERGLRFCFAAEDAAVFYKLRELLKELGVFHGFSLESQNDVFTYYLADKVHYEY